MADYACKMEEDPAAPCRSPAIAGSEAGLPWVVPLSVAAGFVLDRNPVLKEDFGEQEGLEFEESNAQQGNSGVAEHLWQNVGLSQ